MENDLKRFEVGRVTSTPVGFTTVGPPNHVLRQRPPRRGYRFERRGAERPFVRGRHRVSYHTRRAVRWAQALRVGSALRGAGTAERGAAAGVDRFTALAGNACA